MNFAFSAAAPGFVPVQGLKVKFAQIGGDMRDRTADPLLAKQVLSQLSYTPISSLEKITTT